MGRWAGWLACVVALVLAGVLPTQAKDKPTVFGKKLLQVHELPPEALARFLKHDAGVKAKGQKPGLMTGGSESWLGSGMQLPASGNPYRLVVRVGGTVLADGDSGSLWMSGWSAEGQSRSTPVTGTNAVQRKAGERLELSGASAPVSFKEDRNLQPELNFLGSTNLQIDSVTLEVWSGIGNATFAERIGAWTPLMVGVVFLGLFIWFRRG